MTCYHRFFIPDGLSITMPILSESLGRSDAAFKEHDGLVIYNANEVGLLEVTGKDNLMFREDLDLALRYAKEQQLNDRAILNLTNSSSFVVFQPICDFSERFQDMLWRELFKMFPQGMLMFEGGSFRSDPAING